MENMKKRNVIAAYIYLAIPVAIFLVAWLRWYIAIPIISVFVYGLFTMIKEAPVVWHPKKDNTTISTTVIIFAIVLFAVYLSGVGKLTYQNLDHYWRNAIFDTLCDYSWPVYDVSSDGNNVSLVYYISYWLPSALVGKIFGKAVGYCFMALWTALGVWIFYSLVCSYLKKFKAWPLVLFFAFSGLDIISWFLRGNGLADSMHIEWSIPNFQYSSFLTQLFWVFNQAIPAWIITILILLQKNNRNIVFLISLSLLSSTLPFIGLVPIVAYVVFSKKYEGADTKKAWWKCWFKDTFTLQNLLAGGTTGILSFLYLISNPRSSGSETGGLFAFVGRDFSSLKTFLMNYLIFVAVEVVIYVLLVYPYYKKQPLFYIIGATLLVVPLIRMGESYDFCMRVSIPSLVILYLYVTETLQRSFKEKNKMVLIPLVIVLIVGLRTPFNEAVRTIKNTSHGVIDAGTFQLMKDETQINFVARTEDNFFFEHLARK